VDVELYALGAREVLRKPFRPRLLLESIAGVLGAQNA
jgi:hypothetical protein